MDYLKKFWNWKKTPAEAQNIKESKREKEAEIQKKPNSFTNEEKKKQSEERQNKTDKNLEIQGDNSQRKEQTDRENINETGPNSEISEDGTKESSISTFGSCVNTASIKDGHSNEKLTDSLCPEKDDHDISRGPQTTIGGNPNSVIMIGTNTYIKRVPYYYLPHMEYTCVS